jgi:hypothetical protein
MGCRLSSFIQNCFVKLPACLGQTPQGSEIGFDPLRPVKGLMRGLERCWSMVQTLQEAERKSEYQIEKFLSALQE